MVSEGEIEKYIQPILERQYQINQYVIETICKRIKEINKTFIKKGCKINKK